MSTVAGALNDFMMRDHAFAPVRATLAILLLPVVARWHHAQDFKRAKPGLIGKVTRQLDEVPSLESGDVHVVVSLRPTSEAGCGQTVIAGPMPRMGGSSGLQNCFAVCIEHAQYLSLDIVRASAELAQSVEFDLETHLQGGIRSPKAHAGTPRIEEANRIGKVQTQCQGPSYSLAGTDVTTPVRPQVL